MSKCPHCQAIHQVKDCFNLSASQRWLCRVCQRAYTRAPTAKGHSPRLRQAAPKLYLEDMTFRAIAHTLGCSAQRVADWVKAHAKALPMPLLPEQVQTIELDELFTCVGQKKAGLSEIAVDRTTHCIVGPAAGWDSDLCAERCCSDAFSLYTLGIHPGVHQRLSSKSQTYGVEAGMLS
ncbi:MAG: hypothetical protein SNJ58_02120 [Aggregatilineales bacterium]